MADDGLAPGELERVQARIGLHMLREDDSIINRALRLGTGEALHGDARIARQLARRLGEVTADQVTAAAATMDTPTPRNR